MGEAERGVPRDPALIEREPSIGRYLARQRELRGLSLDELADATRIPRRSLERLEAGLHDAQPDGFARGFVRTVALALGLDPADTLARMLGEPRPASRAGQGWGTPKLSFSHAPLLVAALVTLGVASAVWLSSGSSISSGAMDPEQGVVYRQDPVRELAADVVDTMGPPAPPAPSE